MVKKKITKQYALPKLFWRVIGAIVVVVAISVAGLLYWRTGWPAYLQALNKCDGRPPVEVSSFLFISGYTLPGDKSYRIPGDNFENYYCTENEAISAGYDHVQ